jgi:asparagine synthase (glutamine-hydrolysing)
MCGIAGIVGFNRRPIEPDVVPAMTATLTHRGPDGFGVEQPEPWVSLGHRRLSIIDVEGGRQPLSNEDNTIWITFNGEIFNYLELRRELKSKGHKFRTKSDTEVIVHLYEEERTRCVERLNGQYAFAIWDGDRLFCARDPIGIKPFYFFLNSELFAFASEPRAFFAMPDFQPKIDLDGLRLYFRYRYIPAPATALKGVRKLRAGEWLQVAQEGGIERRRYWDLDYSSIGDLKNIHEARDMLESKIAEAVSSQMIADVEVGSFLSGGIDSSAITAVMAAESAKSIPTFTLGFPQKNYDERSFALQVAEYLGTEHTIEEMGPEQARTLIPEILDHMDEPFGDTAILPNYAISKIASKRVKVVLSGDGGDELFAGYGRSSRALRILAIPTPIRPLHKILRNILDVPRSPERWRYADNGSVDAAYHRLIMRTSKKKRRALYGPLLREQCNHSIADPIREIFARVHSLPHLARLLAIDLHSLLAEYHLVKVDRSSMQNSLEVRVPFLDKNFVHFAFRLSPELVLYGAQSKGLLREAMSKKLPENILQRGKRGFGPPLKHWFSDILSDLARDRLRNAEIVSAGLVDRTAVSRLFRPRRSGKVEGATIWRLLVLESWFRNFIKKH